MAYQQKFSRLTDKSCAMHKWAVAGICPCGAALYQSIFLEDYYSSFFSDSRQDTGWSLPSPQQDHSNS